AGVPADDVPGHGRGAADRAGRCPAGDPHPVPGVRQRRGPAAFVPMRFPATTVLVVPASEMNTPLPVLPAMTFPSAASPALPSLLVPITVRRAWPNTSMALPVLVSAA